MLFRSTPLIILTFFLHLAAFNSQAEERNDVPTPGDDAFVYSYFEGETEGLKLVVSRDGLNWEPVNKMPTSFWANR